MIKNVLVMIIFAFFPIISNAETIIGKCVKVSMEYGSHEMMFFAEQVSENYYIGSGAAYNHNGVVSLQIIYDRTRVFVPEYDYTYHLDQCTIEVKQ